MNCPNCQIAILSTDRFCEECGTPLIENSPLPQAQSCGCSKCGATAAAIDSEGYCSTCGFLNHFDNRDRFESVPFPNLAGVCDRGLKHSKNEDFMAVQIAENPHAAVLVVCDGVSSSQSPELASQAAATTTCETICAKLSQGKTAKESMQAAIAAALKSVSAIPYKPLPDADPPSTTLVAAIVQNRTATLGWLGDSRAYWLSLDPQSQHQSQNSKQLTQDDSWLNDMVSSGKMSEAEVLRSPQAHAITGWLGADVRDSAKPSILDFQIVGSGYLLLCTDGLWNYVPEAANILALVRETIASQTQDAIEPEGNAAAICRYLVDFARMRGGHDNITVAILYLSGE